VPRKALKPRESRGFPEPDFAYNNALVSRFINKLMQKGKKSVAESVFYRALDLIKERTKEEPLPVFLRAIENVRPILEVKPRRVGGATYQVPIEVRPERSVALAIRWVLQYAREKEGKSFDKRLAEELIAANKKEGSAIKKREDTHRMAEANKAFAHYRW